ncbi:MAG: NAD(P)H-quinone oxidoreductase [Euzebya sp.]
MRAVVALQAGGPEVLRVVDLPDPEPASDELLIVVSGSAVNRADILQRRGMYPPPPGAPTTLGLELAGTVVAVGTDVSEWAVGQQMCAIVAGGGYATMAVVAASTAMPLPPGLTTLQAAAVPEVFTTAYDAVILQAGLRAGEVVLLHGGSSGVGTAGIQLAKRLGATVVVTVGTGAKAQACLALGADVAINYRDTPDFADAVRAQAGGGVDVVLDIIGGPYLSQNLRVMNTGARMVTIGLMGGAKAELDMGVLLGRRLTLIGSTLRARSVAAKTDLAATMVADVWPGFADGTLEPVIHSTYALAEVAAAHTEMESSTHIGKILLEV